MRTENFDRLTLFVSHKVQMLSDDARSNLVSVDYTRAIARHLRAAAGLRISRMRCRNRYSRCPPNVGIGSAVLTAKSLPCEAVRAHRRNAADRVKMIKILPLEEKTGCGEARASAYREFCFFYTTVC